MIAYMLKNPGGSLDPTTFRFSEDEAWDAARSEDQGPIKRYWTRDELERAGCRVVPLEWREVPHGRH